jgi:hypothetical protein
MQCLYTVAQEMPVELEVACPLAYFEWMFINNSHSLIR